MFSNVQAPPQEVSDDQQSTIGEKECSMVPGSRNTMSEARHDTDIWKSQTDYILKMVEDMPIWLNLF
jgi:hypothetical protein